ncbi:MAG: methyl-accepting chemotaxis protein [Bacteroidota bacterium]|nr:methyl-accepting chemotaxis protein [Bacteroidota bacterium]
MKFQFKNITLQKKLLTLISFTFVPLLILLQFYVLPKVETKWYENKYTATKNLVESVYNTMEYYNKMVQSGEIPLEEAKKNAAEFISAQRYDGDNYYWVFDENQILIAHPLRPKSVGKDMSSSVDANGMKLYGAFVDECKQSGEGFVKYDQLKPGVKEPQPKVSFVKLFKPWGWIVATGVYLNNVDDDISSFKTTIYISLLLALLLAYIIGLLISNAIAKPIKELSSKAEMVAAGNYDVSINVESKDEIGKLATVLGSMITNIKVSLEEVNSQKAVADKAAQNAEMLSTQSQEQEKYLQRNVEKLLIEMEKFASGDLTVSVSLEKSGDNVGKLLDGFNKVVSNFREILVKVSESVQATSSSSAQISSSVEEMSAGAQEQSTQTAEVASSVEEMTQTILETSNHTREVADKSQETAENARAGVAKVFDTKKGMDNIFASTEQTGKIISTLAQKTDQIGEITQVIDDIADQTNLLALNAAIEAARAGEQGRGFAVVADEVRKLAERTTKATKEIADTIKAIQDGVHEANVSMVEATKTVQVGLKLTEEVESSLKKIADDAISVNDLAAQVSASSEEQSKAAEEISRSIDGINTITQESANGVRQIASATEDLNRLTENLYHLVANFKIFEEELKKKNQVTARTY